MSKKIIKDKDKKYVEESYWMKYNEDDLDKHSGIKIRNSNTECYLKRKDDFDEEYWVKCKRVNNKIIEIEKVTVKNLLERLNADMRNYILIMKD